MQGVRPANLRTPVLLLTLWAVLGVACGGEPIELPLPTATAFPAASPMLTPSPTATSAPTPVSTPTGAQAPTPTAAVGPTVTSPGEPSSTPAPALTPAEQLPDLIPRGVLFTLADKLDVQLSPDGTRISYRGPVCGLSGCMMNVWIGDFAYHSAAEPVTRDMTNGIHDYAWAYTNDHILYTQDTDGDEEWRVYSVDINTGRTTRLTPPEGVQANVSATSPKFPDQILIKLNDRDPSLHDLYRMDIRTGERTLVRENEGFLNQS